MVNFIYTAADHGDDNDAATQTLIANSCLVINKQKSSIQWTRGEVKVLRWWFLFPQSGSTYRRGHYSRVSSLLAQQKTPENLWDLGSLCKLLFNEEPYAEEKDLL